MKTQDFDTPNLGTDDDNINDPANQDDYPENVGTEQESSGAGDELDNEDANDGWEDLTDTEDINENEDGTRRDRAANDVDGNDGYPDDKGAINTGVI